MNRIIPTAPKKSLPKTILIIALTIILVPTVAGVVLGGGYVGIQLLKGSSTTQAINDAMNLQKAIMPYVKILMIVTFIVPAVTALTKLKTKGRQADGE